MSRDAAGPRASDDLERAGNWTLSAIVLLAVGVSVVMNDGSPLAVENLALVLLGAVYLVLLLAADRRLAALSGPARLVFYGVELTLVASIFFCQARLGSFGMAWLCLMPLLVQAVLVERRAAVAGLAAVCLLLPVVHLLVLAGWRRTLEPAAGIAACIAFVLLFSAALKRQQEARRRSEELAGELAAANRRLGQMAVRAEELAAARERGRLAREIHDAAGHSLTVASVQLEAATLHLGSDPERARGAIGHAAGAVRQGLTELRASVYALRESPLGPRGLIDALRALCSTAETGGTTVELAVEGAPRPLGPEASLALYRCVQEALTNVRKHAPGARARVLLDYRAGERVAVVVGDDGPGPRESAVPDGTGYGLLGLRERLGLVGGTLATGAGPEGGFEMRAEVPTADFGDR